MDNKTDKNKTCTDTALALAFLCGLIWLYCNRAEAAAAPGFIMVRWPLYTGMAILLAGMLFPAVLSPLAKLWFGLAGLLSLFVPKILLSVIYFLVVLPIALVRRALGHDRLRLRKTPPAPGESVFTVRNHVYTAEDLEHPF